MGGFKWGCVGLLPNLSCTVQPNRGRRTVPRCRRARCLNPSPHQRDWLQTPCGMTEDAGSQGMHVPLHRRGMKSLETAIMCSNSPKLQEQNVHPPDLAELEVSSLPSPEQLTYWRSKMSRISPSPASSIQTHSPSSSLSSAVASPLGRHVLLSSSCNLPGKSRETIVWRREEVDPDAAESAVLIARRLRNGIASLGGSPLGRTSFSSPTLRSTGSGVSFGEPPVQPAQCAFRRSSRRQSATHAMDQLLPPVKLSPTISRLMPQQPRQP